jgi:hypothetical protein
MTNFAIALLIAGFVLIGTLFALLRNWRQPMGTPEQLERARVRNLEIEEQERREKEADEAR